MLELSVTIPPNATAVVHIPTNPGDEVRESGIPVAEALGVTVEEKPTGRTCTEWARAATASLRHCRPRIPRKAESQSRRGGRRRARARSASPTAPGGGTPNCLRTRCRKCRVQ